MASLLDAEDPVMSLLGNIASGFRLGAPDTPVYGVTPDGAPLPPRMSDRQNQTAFDALLAFGSAAANAAAPRFGPAPTFMQGLTESLTAGRQQAVNEQAAQAAMADLALKRQILQQQMRGQQLVAGFLTRGLAPPPSGVTDVTTTTPDAAAGGTPPGYTPGASVREALGAHESGARGYGATNSLGYTGRYQLGAGLSSDAGFYTPAEGENPNSNAWSGQFKIPGFPGVRTRDDFLRTPAAQDAAYSIAMSHNDKNLAALGLYDRAVGQVIGGVPVSRDGLLAGAWLGGPGGVKRWVDSNGRDDPPDANGTRVSDWVRLGAGAPGGAGVAQAQPYQGTGGAVPAASPGPGGTVVRGVDPTNITTGTPAELASAPAPPPTLPAMPAAPGVAAAAAAGPLYLGDSYARGLGGPGVVGAHAATGDGNVLDQIKTQAAAGKLRGQDVVLSTGAVNDGGDTSRVQEQIDEAKKGGANSVTVVGAVDTPKFAATNARLQQIAQSNGARFVPAGPAGPDGVHPADYAALRAATMPAAAAPGAPGVAARTGGVDVAGPGAGASASATAPAAPVTRAATAPAGPPAPGVPARPIGLPPVPGMNRSALDQMTPRDRALFGAALLSMPPDKWPAVAAQLAMKPAETPSYQTIGNQVVGVYRDGTRVVIGPAHQEPFTVKRLDANSNVHTVRVDPNTGTEQDQGIESTPPLTEMGGADGQNLKGYMTPDGHFVPVLPAPTPPGSQPLDPKRQRQELELRQAGQPSEDVTLAQERGRAVAKQQADLSAGGDTAANTLQTLRRFKSVAEGFASGRLAPTAATVGALGQAFGVDLGGLSSAMSTRAVSQAEILQKLSNELTKSQITSGSGFTTNLSDADREFLSKTMPNIANRPESNEVILAFLEGAAQRTIDKSTAWERQTDQSAGAWRKFSADWREQQNKAPIIAEVPDTAAALKQPVGTVVRFPDGSLRVVKP